MSTNTGIQKIQQLHTHKAYKRPFTNYIKHLPGLNAAGCARPSQAAANDLSILLVNMYLPFLSCMKVSVFISLLPISNPGIPSLEFATTKYSQHSKNLQAILLHRFIF